MTREAFDFIHDECDIEAYEASCRDKSIVCECDRCGDDIYEWDTMTAILSADGEKITRYCAGCVGKSRSMIEDVCESCGLWYETGWADDTEARAQSERQKNITRKRTARNPFVVRTAAEMYGQRAF